MSERGRLGGIATLARHGTEHMREIGGRGFKALATFRNGGRKGALGLLVGRGKIRKPWVDLAPAEEVELYRSVGLEHEPREDPR